MILGGQVHRICNFIGYAISSDFAVYVKQNITYAACNIN